MRGLAFVLGSARNHEVAISTEEAAKPPIGVNIVPTICSRLKGRHEGATLRVPPRASTYDGAASAERVRASGS